MQTAMVATSNDWVLYLADLRAALESMNKGPRLANTRVLWRWLDYRCTHPDWCTIGCRRMTLFVPTHEGSRTGRGLPVTQGLPPPVLFQHPLPDMGSDEEAGDLEMRRTMRTWMA